MENITRERWLEVLERVSARRPDECNEDWAWLMKALRLGPGYFLAVHEAIRQGRWRTAEDPGAYLKKVTKREAKKSGLGARPGTAMEVTVGEGEIEGEQASGEEMLDAMEYRQDSKKLLQDNDGVWRSGHGWDAYYGGAMQKPKRRRPRALPEGPGWLDEMAKRAGLPLESEPDEILALPDAENWTVWAKTAGLSDWERKVIEYRLKGTGWRQAVEAQPDEESRRALRAAWRKIERTGLERLKKSLPQNVAKRGVSDTR